MFDYFAGLHQNKLFFDEATICEIFRQILNGVQATHNQKLAHYDLKLDQVLVSMDYKMKITDFGFAKQLITEGQDAIMHVTESIQGRTLKFSTWQALMAPEP